MRKKLAIFTALGMLLVSCSGATASKDVIHIKGQLGDVEARKVEEVPATLSKYKYQIVDKSKGIKVDGTIFKVKTKNGKVYWFIQAYNIKDNRFVENPETGKITRIPVKADIKFLRKIDREIESLGINNKIGNPKNPKMYVIFDAFCPFCIESFKTHCSKFAKKYYISLIPFAVHGEISEKALACMLERMKKENPEKVLGSYFMKFNGNWNEYAELFKGCKYDKKTLNLVKEIKEKLIKNKVSATPTFFTEENGTFYKKVGAGN